MKRNLTLHNDVQEIPLLAAFIDEVAETCNIDPHVAMSINLAMEEAVVNVMNYAYPKGTEGEITVDAELTENSITFSVTDAGVPFDPTTSAEPDITLSSDDRPIGGLGIFLVRQMMDSVTYRRENDKNILTLTKTIK